MSEPWRVSSYQRTDDLGDGAAATWTEYAIDSDDGPICTGIQTQELADEIAVLGSHTDCDCIQWLKGGLIDPAPEHGKQKPTTENLIDRLGVTLEELLMVNRHMLSALQQIAERGGSSVEIDSNGKAGETKIKLKAYAGSAPPVEGALAEYGRALVEFQRRQMDGWAATVDGLERIREGSGE